MSGGHAHGLFVHGDSRVHGIAPECKLVALLSFVIGVALTPRDALWAFAVLGAGVLAVALLSGLTLLVLVRRLAVEVPFLLFAAFLPFFGGGEHYEALGLTFHSEGLWAAWNVVAKSTLGLAATVVVASTTAPAELIRGLQRLKAPKMMVAIAAFMVRYIDLVTGELRRMNVARASRGHDARFLWQTRAIASTAGVLFVRSYERGERVYLAMRSRGFTGALPEVHEAERWSGWHAALAVSLASVTIACVAAVAP